MSEKWQRTPYWRVLLLGAKPWRRSTFYAHVGGIFIEWEYADRLAARAGSSGEAGDE